MSRNHWQMQTKWCLVRVPFISSAVPAKFWFITMFRAFSGKLLINAVDRTSTSANFHGIDPGLASKALSAPPSSTKCLNLCYRSTDRLPSLREVLLAKSRMQIFMCPAFRHHDALARHETARECHKKHGTATSSHTDDAGCKPNH